MTHNFKIVGGDTDSIMFCKPDMSPFPEEEQEALLTEINSLLPKEIKFANDGIFRRVVYVKAKNYIMEDMKGKRKIKGSAFKSSTLEPILKEMLNEFINAIIADNLLDLPGIYTKYVLMVSEIKDIKPWCTKKTLSATTYASQRKNETDIIDAIQDSEYTEGEKIYLYRNNKDGWNLLERFNNDYCWDSYYKKLFNTAKRFSTIMNTNELFPNYSLKKNKKALLESLNIKDPNEKEKNTNRKSKRKSSDKSESILLQE